MAAERRHAVLSECVLTLCVLNEQGLSTRYKDWKGRQVDHDWERQYIDSPTFAEAILTSLGWKVAPAGWVSREVTLTTDTNYPWTGEALVAEVTR